jgi:hypothetical protein
MWNRLHVNQFLPDSAFIVTSTGKQAAPEVFSARFLPLETPEEHTHHINAHQLNADLLA